MQVDNLGIDYIDKRAGLIDAVTPADAKRVAQRLLGGDLLVATVGRTPPALARGDAPGAGGGTSEPAALLKAH